MRTMLILLLLLTGCSTDNGAKKNGEAAPKKAPNKQGARGTAPSKSAEDQTDTNVEDPALKFLSLYVGAIIEARGMTSKTRTIAIEVDQTNQQIQLVDQSTGKPLRSLPYPGGIELLRVPKKHLVMAGRKMAFDGQTWDRRHPMLKESAHVLVRKPGSAQHAFLRFYPDGTYDARVVNYK